MLQTQGALQDYCPPCCGWALHLHINMWFHTCHAREGSTEGLSTSKSTLSSQRWHSPHLLIPHSKGGRVALPKEKYDPPMSSGVNGNSRSLLSLLEMANKTKGDNTVWWERSQRFAQDTPHPTGLSSDISSEGSFLTPYLKMTPLYWRGFLSLSIVSIYPVPNTLPEP